MIQLRDALKFVPPVHGPTHRIQLEYVFFNVQTTLLGRTIPDSVLTTVVIGAHSQIIPQPFASKIVLKTHLQIIAR